MDHRGQHRDHTIDERVVEAICMIVGCDSPACTLTAKLAFDLGADSLDIIEVVMELEDKFDIEIDDGEVDKLQTVGDCIEHVKKKTAGAASAARA